MVEVSMSSQDELLAVLFPKAKNVKWEKGWPIVGEKEEEWSSGFKNFVSAEELGLMVRHAEQPHRVSLIQLHLPLICLSTSLTNPTSPTSRSAPPNAPTKP